ncbi:MAG: UDP-N-acetylglucosamine 1-carboxyvinyltransferase [Clostridia bacterium]|nr:UDP-N-acetylglucosamine 1-carboxyvinyltransferase [Clostridia bacterium]
MQKFEIVGGNRLCGCVKLKGAKNSVLPLLSASLLTEDEVTICECPNILDVENMLKILKELGVKVERDGDKIKTSGKILNTEIPDSLAREMRSSIFLIGSMLGKAGKARTAYPGGCAIGRRPIDLHIKGLKELGVSVTESTTHIDCKTPKSKNENGNVCTSKLHGADIYFEKVSVGATENLILASVLANGRTILRNVAREPEICDLVRMLNAMGAQIKVVGSSILEITGVESLHGIVYTPIPDRIVAGTLMVAVAMCGGEVQILNCEANHLKAITTKLANSSCNITTRYGITLIESNGAPAFMRALATAPYPGFPTDMQAQFVTMMSIANGTSLVSEKVFENRFGYVEELKKLGADIEIVHDIAVVKGNSKLKGATVKATDLRGGSALVLAGLKAEGTTYVEDIFHIDRGYESFEIMLSELGANIKRI